MTEKEGLMVGIEYSATDLYNKILLNDNKFTAKYQKKVREADTDVQNMQDDIKEFHKNICSLKKYKSSNMTKSKLKKFLEKYTDAYNELKDSKEVVSDEKLSKYFKKLESILSDNKKIFKKIGIKESDGKLEFNEEIFKDAKDKDINKLYDGNEAVFKQMDKIIRQITKRAEEKEYNMVLHNFYSVCTYSQENMTQSLNACNLQKTMSSLGSINSIFDSSDEVNNYLLKFTEYYNLTISGKSEGTEDYISYIKNKTLEHEEGLGKLGISILDEKLVYNNVDKDIDYQSEYMSLFGKDAVYGNLIKLYSQNIFNIAMRTESIGVTIDNYI